MKSAGKGQGQGPADLMIPWYRGKATTSDVATLLAAGYIRPNRWSGYHATRAGGQAFDRAYKIRNPAGP